MRYNTSETQFLTQSVWESMKPKPIIRRGENGRLNVPMFVNEEQWNILKKGGALYDILPNKMAKKWINEFEIKEIILMEIFK